jgi:hypothetical protein
MHQVHEAWSNDSSALNRITFGYAWQGAPHAVATTKSAHADPRLRHPVDPVPKSRLRPPTLDYASGGRPFPDDP